MKEARVLLLAGTTEGRKLAEYLAGEDVQVHVCVATEYGESLLPGGEGISVSHQRMNVEEMKKFILEYKPSYVVDATHPFASEVTKNIKEACEDTKASYLRLLRGGALGKEEGQSNYVYVENLSEAIEYLKHTEGKIFATTGSKELKAYTEIPDYKERVIARVLSTSGVVTACEELGFAGRNLICMQGPFSVEMNLAFLKEYDISYLVTKDSGATGGVPEKCQAAELAGVTVILIGRPKGDEGWSYEEVVNYLNQKLGIKAKRKVTLLGIGMEGKHSITLEARESCNQAQVLIGARRMLESVVKDGQETFVAYRPKEIADYIDVHTEYQEFAVVLSGDIGFYSGAKKLLAELQSRKEIEVELLPGISTLSYLSAKLGMAWEDVKAVSVHGRKENLLAALRSYKKVFVLAGSREDIQEIGKTLESYGFGDVWMHVGENLGYENEVIHHLPAREFVNYQGENLAAVMIEQENLRQSWMTPGIPDGEFIRGEVPMTKEEVRSISLSKLRLKKDSIVYDVGAGTGSVSIEAALQAEDGMVYGIETKKEALELLQENAKKFAVSNLQVIEGLAPEELEELPAPDCVFIGGSKGQLEDILQRIRLKNRNARVVINAISLETLSQALEYCKTHAITDEEILQVSVAKSRNVANYHMMTGQNPIYIISFTMKEGEEDADS